MEDENEQLDWGNEDDEQGGEHGRSREHYRNTNAYDGERPFRTNADDADDVVSLGGEEDDMQELVAFQSRSQLDPHAPPSKVLSTSKSVPSPNQSRSGRRIPSDSSPQQQHHQPQQRQRQQPQSMPPPQQQQQRHQPSPLPQHQLQQQPQHQQQETRQPSQQPQQPQQPQPQQQQSPSVQQPQQQQQEATTKVTPQSSPASPQLRRTQPKREVTVTHALPPKPVMAPASFRTPNDSSIMEASTMANVMVRSQDNDWRRVNGSSSKPVSSDDLSPLPHEWEVRRSRSQDHGSQVYYYNTRTEISQWTRPSSSGKPTSPSRSRDRERAPPPASYPYSKNGISRSAGTQHERPSEHHGGRRHGTSRTSTPPADAERRSYGDRRHRSPVAVEPHSSRRASDFRRDDRSPPRAQSHGRAHNAYADTDELPKRTHSEREPFTSQVYSTHEASDERPTRPRRRRSFGSEEVSSTWKEPSRGAPRAPPQGPLPDRTWSGRRDSVAQPQPALGEVQKPRHFNHDFKAENVPRSVRDRPRDDGVTSSSTLRRDRSRTPPRRDSPSPPTYQPSTSRTQRPLSSEYHSRPQVETRGEKGFDRPPSPSWKPPLHVRHDISSDHPPRRPREPDVVSRNTSEHDAKRRRTDDRSSDSTLARRPPPKEESPSSVVPRHGSTPSSFHPAEEEQLRLSKRQVLLPQTERHTGMASPVLPQGAPAPPQLPLSLPRGPRDSGTENRLANTTASIPSGPRHNIPPRPTFDNSRFDGAYPRRAVPSGPSALNPSLARYDGRRHGDIGSSKSNFVADRERDAMDVDTSPTSRFPQSRLHEGQPRTHDGMYSDRDRGDNKDALPTAPRAMSRNHIPPPTGPHNSMLMPPSGPSAGEPSHITKQLSTHEQGWKRPSPPPHAPKRSTRWGAPPSQTETTPRDASLTQSRQDYNRSREAVGQQDHRQDQGESRERQSTFSPVEAKQTGQDRRQPEPAPARHWQEGLPKHPSSTFPRQTAPSDHTFLRKRAWTNTDEEPSSQMQPPINPHQPSLLTRQSSRDGPAQNDVQSEQATNRPASREMVSPNEAYPPAPRDAQRRKSFSEQSGNSRGVSDDRTTQHESFPQTGRDQLHRGSFRGAHQPSARVSRFSRPVHNPVQDKDDVIDQPRTWVPRGQMPEDHGASRNEQPQNDSRNASPPPTSAVSSVASPNYHSSNDSHRGRGQTKVNKRSRSRSRSRDKSPRSERSGGRRSSLPPPVVIDRKASRGSLDGHDGRDGRDWLPSNYRLPRVAAHPATPSSFVQSRQYGQPGEPTQPRGMEAFDREWKRERPDFERYPDESQAIPAMNAQSAHLTRMRLVDPSTDSTIPAPQSQTQSNLSSRMDSEPLPPRMSKPPVRIRRPSTKFSDDPSTPMQEQTRSEASWDDNGRESRGQMRDRSPQAQQLPVNMNSDVREQHHPRDRPGSSLLERLNMDMPPAVTHTPSPSLRERVELPAKWGREEETWNADDMDYEWTQDDGDMSYGHGDPMARRGFKRGRGRPRRARGRGGSWNYSEQ